MANKIIKAIKNPELVFGQIIKNIPFIKKMDDEKYLKLLYRIHFHKRLDLKNPQTFSEKLQWLKLYDRRPEYTRLVDKAAVKDYVAGIIGNEYIIPTIGVWERPENIDWDSLPDQFVLKTTHGGGSSGVVICKNKETFNRHEAIDKLNKSLKQDIYRSLREWPYKDVPRRIIAEKYISPAPNQKDLPDYKFFCFNGTPKYCQVVSGRGVLTCFDFFDYEWNHQPFHEPKRYPFSKEYLERPKSFELMWNLAGKLASDKAFSRIDFYDVDSKVYFGEITLYPTSGFGGFEPNEWDEKFGSWMVLPEKTTF